MLLDNIKTNAERKKWILLFTLGVFLFLLIFWYPWQVQNPSATYVLTPDTNTYVAYNSWKNPWGSHRSIGYPAFLSLFLTPDPHKFSNAVNSAEKAGINVWRGSKAFIYDIAEKNGFSPKFGNIAFVQRLILALSIAVFYVALSCWFPPIFSFAAMVGAVCLAPPPDPRLIMTEPLSCAMTWLSGAFLLWAHKSPRQPVCYALACLCASLAFLVRPQALAMPALCSLLFLHQIIWGGKTQSLRAFFNTVLAFCPLLLAYGYIAWISLSGGQLFFHTHPTIYYSSFCFFAEPEDAEYMPTERAKKFTAYFGKHKAELVHKLENGLGGYAKIRLDAHTSPPRKRHVLGDAFVYQTLGEVFANFDDDNKITHLPLLERNIFGKELNSGLIYRHTGEMLLCYWQNFIGGLGYYRDVWHLAYFPKSSFAINILAIALCVSAVIVPPPPQARWPLVVMLGIHVMFLLSASLGHVMISRYVKPTETFLLLAGICSWWVISQAAYVRLKRDSVAPQSCLH